MRAPASTIWPARKRAAASNGATAFTGCSPRRLPSRRARCSRPISMPSPRSIRPARWSPIPARRRSCARCCGRRIGWSPASSSRTPRPRWRAISRGDRRAKAIAIDGWTALNAYVPPKERRGLVLIDPPFEQPGDFARLARALEAAHRKWPGGIYLLWYPIKERASTGCAGAAPAAFGHREDPSRRARASPRRATPSRLTRLRSDRGQSALDARARARGPAAGARRHPLGRRQARHSRSIGSPAKSSFATFPQPWISLLLLGWL